MPDTLKYKVNTKHIPVPPRFQEPKDMLKTALVGLAPSQSVDVYNTNKEDLIRLRAGLTGIMCHKFGKGASASRLIKKPDGSFFLRIWRMK